MTIRPTCSASQLPSRTARLTRPTRRRRPTEARRRTPTEERRRTPTLGRRRTPTQERRRRPRKSIRSRRSRPSSGGCPASGTSCTPTRDTRTGSGRTWRAAPSLNMEDYIFQIEVPTHEVIEVKGGKRQQVQEKVLPGYILVRMDLTDESWAAVRNTPGVTGFVGLSSRPSPFSLDEVASLLAPEVEEQAQTKAAAKIAATVDFEVGESVTVMDGPFATLPAT